MKRSLLSVLAALPVLAGDFINLTFDEPDLTGSLTPIFPGGPLQGNSSEILRGWSLTVNGQPQPQMEYAPPGTGGGNQAYLVHNSTVGPEGPYALTLISFFPGPSDIRVQQIGTIPADAAGLWIGSAGRVEMFVNGTQVPDPQAGASSRIVDISAFSGQTVDLGFRVVPGFSARFDIFGFVQVPEPSTWALFGVGAAAIFCIGRRKT